MNCRRPPATHPVSQACLAEIQRIQQIWEQCRHEFGQRGPWLFGQFSIADAMYAPVVMRFATYRVELGNVAQAYCDTHLQNPHLKDWVAAGCKEPEVIEADEV